jgi:hypothetical protein
MSYPGPKKNPPDYIENPGFAKVDVYPLGSEARLDWAEKRGLDIEDPHTNEVMRFANRAQRRKVLKQVKDRTKREKKRR